MKYRRLAAFILTLCAVSGCGDEAEPAIGSIPTADHSTARAEAPATEPPDAPEPTTGAPNAPPVPDVLDFTAPTVDGGTFDGSSLAGKPAVLWFWAPWCPVCKQAAADVTAAAAELGNEVAFVGVAGLSGSVEDMQAFVDDTDSGSIPHVADVDGAVFTRFEVVQQDTFAFVNADGAVELVDGYSSDPDLIGLARERFGP